MSKHLIEIKRLREERGRIVREMREMHESAEKENRAFSADEQQKWADMDAEIEAIDARIQRAERLDRELAAEPPAALQTEDGVSEQDAFRAFIRYGMAGLSAEQRAVMARRATNLPSDVRAFSSGTGNTGGYTVPEDFYRQLEIALKAYGPMVNDDVVTVLRTDSGAPLPMPTLNDTTTMGEQIGENTQATIDTSTPFGVVNLGAYIYSSRIVPVSIAFLQDSAFGDSFLAGMLGDRLGRILNQRLTTGTGSGQPTGIVTAAAAGKVGTTGQTTTVTYDDLVDLVHSIDPAYRAMDPAFMMHDSSLRVVRKIKDSQGRPIFVPGYDLQAGMPDTILGYRVLVNQDVPTMAANAKSILFGVMRKYHTRIVRDVALMRLTERYADYLQVGFLAFVRADGALLDAGTNPVKYYQNSAT